MPDAAVLHFARFYIFYRAGFPRNQSQINVIIIIIVVIITNILIIMINTYTNWTPTSTN